MKLKQIAAVVALAAASVPSFATISLPSTGNGELFAVVLDRVDQVSYLVDLGLSMDAGVTGATQFNGASSYSYALNSANFTAFLTAAGASASNFEFAVIAGDATGSTAASPRRLFTTVNQATTTLGNGILTNIVNNTTTYANQQALTAVGQTHTTVDNGDGYAAAGNLAYFLASSFDSFNNQTASAGWLNTVAQGSAATFRSFATSSTSAGGATAQNTFAGVWSLNQSGNAYTLTYSAVPEADGLALMLAGFGAVGFLARRRKAA